MPAAGDLSYMKLDALNHMTLPETRDRISVVENRTESSSYTYMRTDKLTTLLFVELPQVRVSPVYVVFLVRCRCRCVWAVFRKLGVCRLSGL